MSRIGKQLITIPDGVTVSMSDDGVCLVKGPKGELSRTFDISIISISITNEGVALAPVGESDASRSLWGTYASHISNMIYGVTEGYEKKLEIIGVGYRADAQADKIVLHVGYSHPIELSIPEGVSVTVENGIITVSGIDKEMVGQFAANIREVRKPEPYKGKGIRYQDEYVIRKEGKRAI